MAPQPDLGKLPAKENRMFVRNLILGFSLAALVLGTVRGMAALPYAMHGAGLKAPQAWEQALVELMGAQ